MVTGTTQSGRAARPELIQLFYRDSLVPHLATISAITSGFVLIVDQPLPCPFRHDGTVQAGMLGAGADARISRTE
jgi:hypothetical protein